MLLTSFKKRVFIRNYIPWIICLDLIHSDLPFVHYCLMFELFQQNIHRLQVHYKPIFVGRLTLHIGQYVFLSFQPLVLQQHWLLATVSKYYLIHLRKVRPYTELFLFNGEFLVLQKSYIVCLYWTLYFVQLFHVRIIAFPLSHLIFQQTLLNSSSKIYKIPSHSHLLLFLNLQSQKFQF